MRFRLLLTGPNLLLILILLVAFSLRLYGVNWDLGRGFHPDERSFYMRAGCVYDLLTETGNYFDCMRDYPRTMPGIPTLETLLDAKSSPLNPHWFPLGSVLIYLLVYFRALIENFRDWNALDMRYVGRTLTALADVGAVYMVFVLGRKLYGRQVGLLAAALTAFAAIHIQMAHYYRPEPFSVFLALVSLWAMLGWAERRNWVSAAWLGVSIGLALAPKVSLLPLAAPLAVALFYWIKGAAATRREALSPRRLVPLAPHLLLIGGVAALVFVAVTPYALLDFKEFYRQVAEQASLMSHAGRLPFTVQYIGTPAFLYQIQQTAVWGLGIPLGVAAWLGVPFAAWRVWRDAATRRGDLLLLAWVVPQFAFLEMFDVRFLRYMSPIVPVIILFGARLLWHLVVASRDFRRRAAVGALAGASRLARRLAPLAPWLHRGAWWLVVLVVATTAWFGLAVAGVYGGTHPGHAAARWINEETPPATKLVADNHWDEGIPIGGGRQVWQYPLYDPERPQKMGTLAQRLAGADYIYFYSYRPYVSASRDPGRFQYSLPYYQKLFSGELGYELDRTFTNYPAFLGVNFIDDPMPYAGLPALKPQNPSGDGRGLRLHLGYADENAVLYDHPQVLLFRNAARLPEAELRSLLGADTVASGQSAPGTGLTFSEVDRERQQEGGTWAEVFFAPGWVYQVSVFVWLLFIELVYLATLPLALLLFRGLPDRGVVLARVLGLLLVAYLTWLMVSLRWLEFSALAVWLAVGVVAAVSAAALAWRWQEISAVFRRRWKLLLIGEALFVGAYLAFVLIRAANPDLWHPYRGGEKPMELAYLTAVARSTLLPPYDPWFAGGQLNYYYWGYFVLSIPIRATGIIPATAFNLAVPLLFALTFTGAYTLAYNLTAAFQRSRPPAPEETPPSPVTPEALPNSPEADAFAAWVRRNWRRWLTHPVAAGVAAALFVAVLGNMDGMVQAGQAAQKFVAGERVPRFDFWRSSRMFDPPIENFDPSPLAFWVPDKNPDRPDVSWHITEFPFFTFLFADLHAHMMVMPFTLLAVALGFNLAGGAAAARWRWLLLAAAALGLAAGSLYAINTWDYPTLLLLAFALAGLAALSRPEAAERRGAWFLLLAGLILVVSFAAWLPFRGNIETFNAGIEASRWRTPFDRYWAVHALFLLVSLTFLVWQARPALARLLGIGLAPGERNEAAWLRLGAAIGLVAVAWFVAIQFVTAAFLTALLTLTGLAAWETWRAGGQNRPLALAPLLLLAGALAIGVMVDIVRLKDDIGRMNTLFKYYLEAWLLFGVATAYFLGRIVHGWLLRSGWGWVKVIWVAFFGFTLVSCLIYPVFGTRARLADRFDRVDVMPLTLDGTAYMERAVQRENGQALQLKWDRDAIGWLRENVQGSPVVLEAHGDQYHWNGRISVYTGLPTVLGWPWHQMQQRMGYRVQIDQRIANIRELYSTTDEARTLELLRAYHVEYVAAGQLERAYYPPEGLAKFERLAEEGKLQAVYRNQETVIYRLANEGETPPTALGAETFLPASDSSDIIGDTMSAAEVIAMIRDLFIIVFCGLGIFALLALAVGGFKVYRSVKRITNKVEEMTETVKNQVVLPLAKVGTVFTVVSELVSRVAGMARRKQSEEGRKADAESDGHG